MLNNHMAFLGVFSFMLFLGAGFLPAQNLTLDSIFSMVEKNNPELKLYDARINAFKTYATGAKSYEPPQVGAGFFMTPYDAKMWNGDAMTGFPGMGSFMISAQQMFINPGKLNANSDYMNSMSKVDEEMKNAMRNELRSMVKMNYYEWIILKKKLIVLKESEELLNYIIKSTEIRYTHDMDKLNAYYKAKAMLGDMQNMRLMIEYEVLQKMIALNALMNRDKQIVFDIDTSYSIKHYEKLAIDTMQIGNNRSDLKSLNQEIGLLKSKQRYERSKRNPDFGVKYDHMLAFGDQPQQFSLMFMVTIPIAPWSSKMYKSTVAGLDFEMDAVKYRRQTLLNNSSGNLYSYKEQIKGKMQQISLYEKTIILSMRKNYETSLIAYEQGREELFMTLDSWQNLKLVQLSYLDLLNELLQLQVNYEKELELK